MSIQSDHSDTRLTPFHATHGCDEVLTPLIVIESSSSSSHCQALSKPCTGGVVGISPLDEVEEIEAGEVGDVEKIEERSEDVSRQYWRFRGGVGQ